MKKSERQGGGAVVSAIVSSKLLRLGSVQAAEGSKRNIPDGISLANFWDLKKQLEKIRDDVNALDVIMRLNKTGKRHPAPVFVGWVENKAAAVSKSLNKDVALDPGLIRFGEQDVSDVYNEIFKKTLSNGGGIFVERNWPRDKQGSKRLVPRAKLKYQRYTAIVVNSQCVGTLSVVLGKKPESVKDRENLDKSLINWAQDSKSRLVTYIRDNFDYSGQAIKKI